MGNTDRQQSDSRARAEGRGKTGIKKEKGYRTGESRDGQTDGKRERGQSEKWANREPSLFSPFWVLANSQLLHQQQRTEKWRGRKDSRGEKGGTDQSSGKRWRGEAVEEEDAALMNRKTGAGGWRWRRNGNGGDGGFG